MDPSLRSAILVKKNLGIGVVVLLTRVGAKSMHNLRDSSTVGFSSFNKKG